ncbi:hypothetical protein [Rhizobium sp. MHM7A]|uniref:hypothetical protein n=1 Tax=Rhizobium sp. MHM7A TaxID=2583233 RepID=UPI0011068368|nr:hypothetical protein [Rhizobium sp. MHM7A]TLX16651.1 hypothetical protein FFR93_04730 [Rhizobium sp. MHM7A]
MPNAERTIPDEFASESAPRRPMRFADRPPGSTFDLRERISSNDRVMKALSSLGFVDGPWSLDADLKNEAKKAMEAVLADGNDIGMSLSNFFARLRDDSLLAKASVHTRTVAYPNDLWKREPFFGVVTPFHTTSVAAAIRKRPDLVGLLGEWYRVFDELHIDDFPEVAPENIDETADELIRDALKFATFEKSKLGTMTVMVGQHMYQIRKRGCHERNALEMVQRIEPHPAGERKFNCTNQPVFLENLCCEGRMLSASLLIQGNRVLAMGTDDTTAINQIFAPENLGNLLMTEHIFFQQETQDQVTRKTESDALGFDTSVFDFDIPEEKSSQETKHVPLTEEFFDIIADAVGQTCVGTRAIFTARVLITDTNVRIFAYEGDRLWRRGVELSMPPKLDNGLLESLHFANFEQEIADIEKLADQALESKVFASCLEYLDFDEGDILDLVKKKMVEILVDTVKERNGVRPENPNHRELWRELEAAKQDGCFYMNAVFDRYCASSKPSPKRPFRSMK